MPTNTKKIMILLIFVLSLVVFGENNVHARTNHSSTTSTASQNVLLADASSLWNYLVNFFTGSNDYGTFDNYFTSSNDYGATGGSSSGGTDVTVSTSVNTVTYTLMEVSPVSAVLYTGTNKNFSWTGLVPNSNYCAEVIASYPGGYVVTSNQVCITTSSYQSRTAPPSGIVPSGAGDIPSPPSYSSTSSAGDIAP